MPLQLWAFARDSLMPGSKYMRRLDKISQTPALASECCLGGGSVAQAPGPEQLYTVPCRWDLSCRSMLTAMRLAASWVVPCPFLLTPRSWAAVPVACSACQLGGCTCNNTPAQVTACRHCCCCLLEDAGHKLADICWARAQQTTQCASCLQHLLAMRRHLQCFCLLDGGPQGGHALPAICAGT